jgi:hypothetical protein
MWDAEVCSSGKLTRGERRERGFGLHTLVLGTEANPDRFVRKVVTPAVENRRDLAHPPPEMTQRTTT